MKIRDIVIIVVLALSIFLVSRIVIQNFVVDGSSMEPNLYSGQWILVNKVVYRLHSPQRGDIVVLRNPSPNNSSPVLIKRIIGLPGEEVKIESGKVYIDGKLLTEEYIKTPTDRAGEWSIAENHYFVMGDNRTNSVDSRDSRIGPIEFEDIIGKAWLRIWPLRDWGLAPNYIPQLDE